jgi:hypothetical protein
MQAYCKNHRRTRLRVESLEGKTLLSTDAIMQHVAHHVSPAPMVVESTPAFSGTLTGSYSTVHGIPFVSNVQSYATSGILSGVGSTSLRGTLIGRPGRLAGADVLRNDGGRMTLDVFRTGTPGTFRYRVVRARGSDAGFKRDTGTLKITLNRTLSVPYYTYGQATTTFS